METPKNLFYSETEQLAFWITGYGCQFSNLNQIITHLELMRQKAAKILNVPEDKIQYFEIMKSSRYKNMEVFYTQTPNRPEGAYQISGKNEWTMSKYISY